MTGCKNVKSVGFIGLGKKCYLHKLEGIDEITGKSPSYVALSIAAQLAIWQRFEKDHNDGSWAINHSGVVTP